MAKVDVGDAAPDFALPGTGGKTYRLSDYAGRNLVLAFYPGDATTVCTKQFCSYRDRATSSTASTPRCSASRRSRSTRTSTGPRSRN